MFGIRFPKRIGGKGQVAFKTQARVILPGFQCSFVAAEFFFRDVFFWLSYVLASQ